MSYLKNVKKRYLFSKAAKRLLRKREYCESRSRAKTLDELLIEHLKDERLFDQWEKAFLRVYYQSGLIYILFGFTLHTSVGVE